MNTEFVVVGSGFAGCIIARFLAEHQKKVLLLERRDHIAGNMYDEKDDTGIRVQRYGPHIFHTNDKKVHDYITTYGAWDQFHLKCKVDMDGILVPSPFNFTAIDQMYPFEEASQIKNALITEYPGKKTITIDDLLQSENNWIKQYAEKLFNLDYRPYTAKQWGISPDLIDISVLRRVPVRLDNIDGYFNDTYQCMPREGFTDFFRTLISHPNITVETNVDALSRISIEEKFVSYSGNPHSVVIYTGAIDELFEYRYGRLPYRSLRFEYNTAQIDSFQPAPVVSYPKAEGYTRITEYKKLPVQQIEGVTTYVKEYPLHFDSDTANGIEPYYPILNEDSRKLYKQYYNEAEKKENLYLCGRLAEYQYYNMDQVILRALDLSEKIKKEVLL